MKFGVQYEVDLEVLEQLQQDKQKWIEYSDNDAHKRLGIEIGSKFPMEEEKDFVKPTSRRRLIVHVIKEDDMNKILEDLRNLHHNNPHLSQHIHNIYTKLLV